MILYFSATGNCKYAASRIASHTGEKILSIPDCIKDERYSFCEDVIGVITPIYFWGLPDIVEEFLKKLDVKCSYLYLMATYGTTTGAAGKMAQKALKGRNFDAFYAIQMPDTWTPLFDLSTPAAVAKFTRRTEQKLDAAIKGITDRKRNKMMQPAMPAVLALGIAQPMYHHIASKTSRFSVEDSCIGCGHCAKHCPVQAIAMQAGKPVWVKERCVLCLGCLHRCPKFSIQYGLGRTKRHGQYTNPYVPVP
ncbi:EFR1 family ferrodoxin [Clostridium sp. SY8519]|uniref:EFR1 family ferrodoxin n=1 Tax=Clostridium sp. (strain SY8519) TaxID=1042156 RepID=UPI00059F7A87|nr:EFR1 family ferrodoxin [Clostridium sp. SY8519]